MEYKQSIVKPKTVMFLIVLLTQVQIGMSQFYNLPNDYFFNLLTDKNLSKIDSVQTHSSIQPYIHFYNKRYEFMPDTFKVFKFITDDPLLDKVFYDHLIHINSKKNKFDFKVDPLLNIELGRSYSDTANYVNTSSNTRGFIASGTIGTNFYFETMFAENQSFFPYYISNFNKQTNVVPGQGRFKSFKVTGYDYAFSSGFISYQATKNVNLQIGHGKQKIGNGYRSLLLSDNAFNYPYIRLTTQWLKGKIQYTNIYAALMNLETGGAKTPPFTEPLFQKKAMAIQFLSFNVSKRINLGLFQSMVWNASDSMNRQHLEWQYMNPIIFSNLGFYGLNNKNNIMLGANSSIKLSSHLLLYAQFMADDLSRIKKTKNGIGYQVGIKYFDVLKLKNSMLQLEYNHVAEGSYTSPIGTVSNQSYSHYNQNLAFTPGYGTEFVGLFDYKYKRFFMNVKLNTQRLTINGYEFYTNTISNFGLGYTINPAYNFNVSLHYVNRQQVFTDFNASNNITRFYTLSLKSNLYNTYYDF